MKHLRKGEVLESSGITLNMILYFNCSGLGRVSSCHSSIAPTGAVTSASPNTSFSTSTSTFCCCALQCTSAEMMMGYGDAMKAYEAIAVQTSLTGTDAVRVLPWVTSGSTSPS